MIVYIKKDVIVALQTFHCNESVFSDGAAHSILYKAKWGVRAAANMLKYVASLFLSKVS